MGKTFKRKIVVSSVDANSGSYVQWDENSADPMKAVLSSAAIPFAFPDVKWDDPQIIAMDGGSVWNTNLVSAVQRCRETVDSDSQITIDIVVCFAHNIDDKYAVSGNTIDNFMRYKDIKEYYNGMDDVLEYMRAFPDVNFRYYVQPSAPLPIFKMLNVNNETSTYPMQMQGRLDGENAIKSGEHFIYNKLLDWNQQGKSADYVSNIIKDEAEKWKQQRMWEEDVPLAQ